MTIVSEGGQVTRTCKAKLRAVPETKAKTAGEPKRAKQSKEKESPAATRCDLCGATDKPVRYVDGNAACESCAPTAQSGASVLGADETRVPDTKRETEPETKDAVIPLSLGDLARRYAEQMQKDGKTPATIAGYVNDLGIALREIGAETLVADLTPKLVGAYFECDAVMLLRSGGNKSQLSIDKTRRVLRLALDHAVELGWIATAPIPEAKHQ
jgi:hypothetical protein